MKRVYIAKDPVEAALIRGVLEQEKIAAIVQGADLFNLRGEVPVTEETLPSVWVSDEDYDRAVEILGDYEITEKEE